ncbi:hypothetical protein [Arthrobacter antibioticus]|uniref:hypothetical protein n=1 Tax=Arthrobacter sp. H35-MC1 TaxID=3046203 RepID=UPI0024BBE958|nr:hypothetical protein [Arthrobacter sp. H35-MC1]MDJ0318857.1 hypothetical protein [Arthrobacter sp. H35-MC1]
MTMGRKSASISNAAIYRRGPLGPVNEYHASEYPAGVHLVSWRVQGLTPESNDFAVMDAYVDGDRGNDSHHGLFAPGRELEVGARTHEALFIE